MSTFIATILLSILILLLFFAGLGIRILVLKNGSFRGSCSGNNPYNKQNGEDCPVCGKKPEEECKNNDLPAVA